MWEKLLPLAVSRTRMTSLREVTKLLEYASIHSAGVSLSNVVYSLKMSRKGGMSVFRRVVLNFLSKSIVLERRVSRDWPTGSSATMIWYSPAMVTDAKMTELYLEILVAVKIKVDVGVKGRTGDEAAQRTRQARTTVRASANSASTSSSD